MTSGIGRLLPSLQVPRARRIVTGSEWVQRGLLGLATVALFSGVVLPLVPLAGRSLADNNGTFVGLDNYVQYFASPALSVSLINSLTVSLITTLLAVGLAFGYAYALARTCMPFKGAFGAIALLPLLAPSLAQGIGLVYLFGNKGLVTTGFLGWFEHTFGVAAGFDIHLYGMNGIILGELLYCFPQAFLILIVAANLADARLYEASTALRASSLRTFFTVTLPGLRYGLVSATFVCFTLVFTDFGVPKVVGGNFNVLATDIYKQVVGQQNLAMGATISMLLLLLTVLAFVVDRLLQRRQVATLTARAVPFAPKPNRRRDTLALLYCLAVALAILAVMATILLASLVDVWPYKLNLTLRHYDFSSAGGGGWGALWNSLVMSFYTALFGVIFVFASAYLVEKVRTWPGLRSLAYFFSVIPVALPGLVIGLAFVFLFNPLHWQVGGIRFPNPLTVLYGTMAILVIANIVHFYTVSFLTATTALKQIDGEFEAISESLRVPFYRTFWRVTLPLCLPAILEIAMYFFVSAMVTVSAVVFLYSPTIRLAAVAIVNMDDAGNTASAAAMSVMIILASLLVRLGHGAAAGLVQRRTQRWRIRN